MQQDRPLSPHMQIYKPQLTSVLSITHRATGMFLSFGALLLVAWLVSIASGLEIYLIFSDFIKSFPGQALLFGLVFSLYFHLLNGIRHLFWDCGLGFELPATYISGWLVVAVTLIATLATWIIL